MTTFALITEGITDQVILEYIVDEVCGELFDSVDINPLQPIRDATDAVTAPHGGWELALEYCGSRLHEALIVNDYVIVHIDTDCGDDLHFGLQLTEGGEDRKYEDLIEDATKIIMKHVGESVPEPLRANILFAIAVHSLESWILLYMFNINKPKNSFNHLARELTRTNRGKLTKDVQCYTALARNMKRRKLQALALRKNSFGVFLLSLCSLPPDRQLDG